MRAWLCLAAVAAALALCLWPASAEGPPGRVRHDQISAEGAPERARLDHIKRQILSKLGLGSRPPPLRAPPRDVVRQILARAADPRDSNELDPHDSSARDPSDPRARLEEEAEDSAPREIIAIAKRGELAFEELPQQKKRSIYIGPYILQDKLIEENQHPWKEAPSVVIIIYYMICLYR